MHRSSITAMMAAFGMLLASQATLPAFATPGGIESIDAARQQIEQRDARGAVALLEAALVSAKGKDRSQLIEPLRAAYNAAIQQAERDGKTAEADGYRDDLEILKRKPRARSAAPPEPEAKTATVSNPTTTPVEKPIATTPVEADPPSEPIRPLLDEPVPTQPLPASREPEKEKEPKPVEVPAPLFQDKALSDPAVKPAEAPVDKGLLVPDPAPIAEPVPAVGEADAAFVAKRYEQAGRIYAELDRRKALPPGRHDHWAYCRSVNVVRRINARPEAATEWASIEHEIQDIQNLCPKSWFAEYLKNRASERNQGTRPKALASNAMVVRGSSPDEAPAPKTVVSAEPVALETPNFRIIHSDRALAETVAKAAEVARTTQVNRWTQGAAPIPSWSNKCEIHLYPTSEAFCRETGQRPESAGFSTMSMSNGKVVARRINLRADHPNLVKAILPHEITHVILADLFPDKQIPRWADEGIAVLAEPTSEQALRAADLEQPLASGKLFELTELFAMDYPKSDAWSVYYAQSVSMTRFLVESGTPAKLLVFLRESQNAGAEKALETVYGISSVDELQKRWLEYARTRSSGTLTASSDRSDKPATRVK